MYILSAAQISAAISGLAGQGCTVPAQSRFDTLLTNVRTRAEEALNVHSILKKVWVDHFRVPVSADNTEVTLRLSNGFLRADKGVIINSLVDGDLTVDHEVDRHMGLVIVTLPAGTYKVTYMSGFAADVTTDVFTDSPDWLQSIAIGMLVQWVRLISSAAIPKDISYGALNSAMIREIATRVYERYMRPRANTIWVYRQCRELDPATVLPVAEE